MLSAQVVEKDLLIQEKEKLYMELKNILSRQPGPEVAEQLSIYQVRTLCECGFRLCFVVHNSRAQETRRQV
jgi:hypothetical protein